VRKELRRKKYIIRKEPKRKGKSAKFTNHHRRAFPRRRTAIAMAAAVPSTSASLLPIQAAPPLSGSTGESLVPLRLLESIDSRTKKFSFFVNYTPESSHGCFSVFDL
jgi:hypothetical protein